MTSHPERDCASLRSVGKRGASKPGPCAPMAPGWHGTCLSVPPRRPCWLWDWSQDFKGDDTPDATVVACTSRGDGSVRRPRPRRALSLPGQWHESYSVLWRARPLHMGLHPQHNKQGELHVTSTPHTPSTQSRGCDDTKSRDDGHYGYSTGCRRPDVC